MTRTAAHRIDHSFKLIHRRLRERFGMERIERHEERVCRAVEARVAKLREGRGQS